MDTERTLDELNKLIDDLESPLDDANHDSAGGAPPAGRKPAGTGAGIAAAIVRLLATLLRVTGAVGHFVDDRLASVRATWKQELRRVSASLVHALVAAFFICAAAAWAAAALMMAFWETHRVLVASLLAGAFAVLALVALLLLRRDTR